MKYLFVFFILLSFSGHASQEEDLTEKYPNAPLMKTINPRYRIVDERVLLLPINANLRKDLIDAYSNPSNMKDEFGELVANPFDRWYFRDIQFSSIVWCMISRNGPFGHILLNKQSNKYSFTVNFTEISRQSPLVQLAVSALVFSGLYQDGFECVVFSGNTYLKQLLESVGFKLTMPGKLMQRYETDKIAEIEEDE